MVMIMMSNIVVRSDPEADCCDVERVGDEVAHVPHVAHVPDDDVEDDDKDDDDDVEDDSKDVDEDDMKSWSLCESNVPQLLDLAPNEAGNLNEVYE